MHINHFGPQIITLVLLSNSHFFPFGFQYRRWGEFVEVSIRFIFCDHAFKSHVQPVLWSFVITRRNFKLITLTAQSLNMGIKGMDKAKSPHDKGVLITGVGSTRSFVSLGPKKTTPNPLRPNMHLAYSPDWFSYISLKSELKEFD